MLNQKKSAAFTALICGFAALANPVSAQWTRSGTNTFVTNSGDRVGVGISAPLVKFDVRGGQFMVGPNAGAPGVATLLPSGGGAWWNFGNTNNGAKFVIASGDMRAANDNSSWNGAAMAIQLNGFVGIGTLNPQSTLAVNGTITTKSLVVTNTGWADYVFKKDYDLKSLSNVEKFIQSEGHLPGIPKASAVAKNGVNVGEMQVKLLEKVEELTLYMIQQNKKIENLAARNTDLEARLANVVAK